MDELKELCEKYLDAYEYCDKMQYLSKYDERMDKEWLDGWIELVGIRAKMYMELTKKVTEYEKQEPY